MGVGVDEAGSYVEALGIDDGPSLGERQVPYRCDAISLEGHIHEAPGIPRSVKDSPAADEDVVPVLILCGEGTFPGLLSPGSQIRCLGANPVRDQDQPQKAEEQ
jgi:hypothetical protein